MSFDEQFRKGLGDYYRQQRGGSFPVFQGAEYQYGNGIGDFFRSIARFVLPIFAPAACSFITSAASNLNEGKTLKDSAVGALRPALGEAMNATGSQIMSRIGQRGGRRRRHKRKCSRIRRSSRIRHKRSRAKSVNSFPFSVYKGAGRRKRKHRTSSHRTAKRRKVRFLSNNF